MNLRIVKKDLRRKKSINLILLIFIFLSTMFIAGSLNNFTVILNGVEYFMEQAGIGDFLVVTMGGTSEKISENDRKLEEFLKNQKDVGRYTIDDNLFLSENQFKGEKGKKIELSSTGILNALDIKQQKFFDENNQEISHMEDGTIYIAQKMAEENHLEAGDIIKVSSQNGYEKTFQVAGTLKDAFLGSDMMGTLRFVISRGDFEEFLEKSDLPYGRLYSVFCTDVESFRTEYNNNDFNEIFGAEKSLVKTTYVMEMVIAAVILLVSICLIAIAVIMLRFTIVFTVNEDYKEIGIMKAIGMRDFSIRKLYLMKYFVLAVSGGICGFAASIPFSRGLLAQVTEKIVIERGKDELLFQFFISMVVIALVVLFGFHSTGKIKKFSPMDAIRSGNNGERFRKKGVFRLKNARVKTTTFLACNDVMSEKKKYLVLLLASMIGVWLVVMPVNTINTLNSDKIAAWFALTDCDFCVQDEAKVVELNQKGTKQGWYEYLEETKKLLLEHGIEAERTYTEIFFKLKVRKGNKTSKSFAIQGLGTSTDQYFYDEGEPPLYENEVAVTHIVAEQIGAGLGDTIYITNGGEEKPYIITALYQSMNNMGEGIRFTERAELDYKEVTGGFGLQVILRQRPEKEELLEIIEQAQKLLPDSEVETLGEFVNSMLGNISGRIEPLKMLILAVVLVINVLVVVLMQKMLMIRERGEIGMMKSIGFSNRAVIGWQTKRVMLVLFIGIVLGILTGTPFSEITSGQVFRLMGAEKIEFVINPLEVYFIYPVALFLTVTIACVITMRKVKKISVQEMNGME